MIQMIPNSFVNDIKNTLATDGVWLAQLMTAQQCWTAMTR